MEHTTDIAHLSCIRQSTAQCVSRVEDKTSYRGTTNGRERPPFWTSHGRCSAGSYEMHWTWEVLDVSTLDPTIESWYDQFFVLFLDSLGSLVSAVRGDKNEVPFRPVLSIAWVAENWQMETLWRHSYYLVRLTCPCLVEIKNKERPRGTWGK